MRMGALNFLDPTTLGQIPQRLWYRRLSLASSAHPGLLELDAKVTILEWEIQKPSCHHFPSIQKLRLKDRFVMAFRQLQEDMCPGIGMH